MRAVVAKRLRRNAQHVTTGQPNVAYTPGKENKKVVTDQHSPLGWGGVVNNYLGCSSTQGHYG